jgi:hypothetical protein
MFALVPVGSLIQYFLGTHHINGTLSVDASMIVYSLYLCNVWKRLAGTVDSFVYPGGSLL